MIKDITFFHTRKELEAITGLTHEELWEHGFNLDDMDWGIVTSNVNLVRQEDYGCVFYEVDYNNNEPYIIQLLNWMENYCAGYSYVEYNGKQYFTLHHA